MDASKKGLWFVLTFKETSREDWRFQTTFGIKAERNFALFEKGQFMRLALVASGSLLLLSLAACSDYSGSTATGATPAGAASTSRGSSAQMPQSSNSLPAGAAVSAPITDSSGRVGTTRY